MVAKQGLLDFMAAQPQQNFPLCIVRASFPVTTHPTFCLNTKLQYHGEDQLGALQCPKFPQTQVCTSKLTCNSKTQLFSCNISEYCNKLSYSALSHSETKTSFFGFHRMVKIFAWKSTQTLPLLVLSLLSSQKSKSKFKSKAFSLKAQRFRLWLTIKLKGILFLGGIKTSKTWSQCTVLL